MRSPIRSELAERCSHTWRKSGCLIRDSCMYANRRKSRASSTSWSSSGATSAMLEGSFPMWRGCGSCWQHRHNY
eukprot:5471932-Prorocentrum_lima.AAC.1